MTEQESLDKYFSGLVANNEPGLAAVVIRSGQLPEFYTAGVADIRTLQPITSKTNFRLASVTKQFTACAVMLLVRDGRLQYDQSLKEYFPDFPAYGQAITIRHLLTHTSGLPDYEDLLPPADPARTVEEQQITDNQVLELLKQQRRGKFRPGEEWSYSNSGYVLLGLMVEKASGQPLDQFLHDRILPHWGWKPRSFMNEIKILCRTGLTVIPGWPAAGKFRIRA